MKIKLIAVALAIVLSGCVSQANQKALSDAQAGCTAGDHDACTAAGYQAQANQQEQQANAAAAQGIGAALLGGAVAGAAIVDANRPVYVVPTVVYVPRRAYFH
jgi:hypothetical protein